VTHFRHIVNLGGSAGARRIAAKCVILNALRQHCARTAQPTISINVWRWHSRRRRPRGWQSAGDIAVTGNGGKSDARRPIGGREAKRRLNIVTSWRKAYPINLARLSSESYQAGGMAAHEISIASNRPATW